ncbi:MAG: OmpA family protein [Bacteroidales bacterium]|nr:OmpA family protein [Bacteroidales bacterium]
MKIKQVIIFIFISLLFSPSIIFAQRNPTRSADEAFENQRYFIAIDKYKKAYSKVKKNKPEKNRVIFQIAECYRLTNNLKRAEAQYKRLIRAQYDKKEPLVVLHYADALKANNKYDLALVQYNNYSELAPDDPRGLFGAEACRLIKEWEENPSKYEITQIKKINSRESDFSPVYENDNFNSIIFTSTREGATGKETDDWTGQNFSDLFSTKIDRKGEWSTPKLLGAEDVINTKANEGAPFMNSSFNALYFTRCMNSPKKQSGCFICRAERRGRTFNQPKGLDLSSDSTIANGHPTLSSDELTIIFASDREGGYGGRDLWIATRKSKTDEFNRPQNIGPEINTLGDELFPFLRNDSVLYFSSNGHLGIGGLDIYKSTKTEKAWSEPKNLKMPLNSNGDDFGIVFHPNKERGFFSSSRKGGRGKEDIYEFIEPPVLFTLSGVVKDDRTLQYAENADVKIIGSDGISLSTKTNNQGVYTFTDSQILEGTSYDIIVSKEDYFVSKGKITTIGLEFSKDFEHDFIIVPIPEKPIVLPEILYDLAKWDLKPQYQDSLQGLIKTLDENETLTIELASHTDLRDSDERNDILSQKRAQSVVDYLILRGIDPARLTARGYGERVPRTLVKDIQRDGFSFPEGTVLNEEYIESLETNAEKEVAHQLNRRTEFSVIRKNYVPRQKNEPVAAGEVNIVVNPEEHFVKYEIEKKTGALKAECFVNDMSINFYFEDHARPYISISEALKLLKEGALSKEDFKGDPNVILANGTIANKAVFTIKDFTIANITIHDIEITVDNRARVPFVIGKSTLSLFGKYTIDKGAQVIKF